MLYREVSNMEKAKEEVSKMHECPNYNDCAFPVSMHTITKYDILSSYRVMVGMELLRTTDLDITDIAFRVGFNDSSYFIQAFKKKNGMTPKQYRNHIF